MNYYSLFRFIYFNSSAEERQFFNYILEQQRIKRRLPFRHSLIV